MPHHYVEVVALCELAHKRFISLLHTSRFYGEQLTPATFRNLEDALRSDLSSEIPQWAQPVFDDLFVRFERLETNTLTLYSGNLALEEALTRRWEEQS